MPTIKRRHPHFTPPEDIVGRQGFYTGFGDAVTATRQDHLAVRFAYGLSPYAVNVTETDGGTATTANDQAVLTSGATATGLVRVESTELVRYSAGHMVYAQLTPEFECTGEPGQQVGIQNADQFAYIGDEDDGFAIGFRGDAQFCIRARKGGVDTYIYQDDFSIDTLDGNGYSKAKVDFSKALLFNISFGWLGADPIEFMVKISGYGWVHFHTIEHSNVKNGVSINNPVIPLGVEVINTGATAGATLKVACLNGGIVGEQTRQSGFRTFPAEGTKIIVADTLTNIVTIRSQDAFLGRTNKIHSILDSVIAAVDGNKNVTLHLLLNATLDGTANFIPVDAASSVMEVDTSGVVVTGGVHKFPIPLNKTGNIALPMKDFAYVDIHPGDSLTLAASSTGASEVSGGLIWSEAF